MGPEYTNKTLDINDWMAVREYPSRRRFFGGCPQFEDMCLKGKGRHINDRWWWPKRIYPDDPSKCVVQGDPFALIYFRPSLTTPRDLCANGGWGDDLQLPTKTVPKDTVTKTATFDSVIFPRHSEFKSKSLRSGLVLFF